MKVVRNLGDYSELRCEDIPVGSRESDRFTRGGIRFAKIMTRQV